MDQHNTEQIPKLEFAHSSHRPRRTARLAGRTSTYVAAAAAGLLLAGGGGYALASSSSKSIHGCVNKKTDVVSVRTTCGQNARALVWDRQGPQGKPGTTTTITKLAPSGWTVDYLSEGGLFAVGNSDTNLSSDSHGIESVMVKATGEYQVEATGCHDHAPTVIAQADPGADTGGTVAQADALAPTASDGFQPVQAARPGSNGLETFDVFTYVPNASAGNSIADHYISDADLGGNDFTLLIYC